jgi:Na+-transporting NADH:ubiquinone oxidoreductase subunit NqrC
MDIILRFGAPYVITMYAKNLLVATHTSIRSLPQLKYNDIPTSVSVLIYAFIYAYVNGYLYRDPNLFDDAEEAEEAQVVQEVQEVQEAEEVQEVQETKEVQEVQETKEVPILNVVVKPLEGQGPISVPVVTQTNCNPCSNRRKV